MTTAAPVMCIAEFSHPTGALGAEELLARWSAEGSLEILDGVVAQWSAPGAGPRWRSLENLPRLAALPDAAWSRVIAALEDAAAVERHLVVAVCAPPVAMSLLARLRDLGASVRTDGLTVDDYAALRGGRPRPRRGGPDQE